MCMGKSEACFIINKIMSNKFGLEDINLSLQKLETDYNCSEEEFSSIYTALLEYLNYDNYTDNLYYYWQDVDIEDNDVIVRCNSLDLRLYSDELYKSNYPELILNLVNYNRKIDLKDVKDEKFYKNMSRKQFLEVVSFINEYFLKNIEQFGLMCI